MEPSSIRWRRVLAAIAILLAVLELGSRAAVRIWAGQPYESFAPHVFSPYGLVRNNPKLTSPGFHINGQGFRNVREFTREKPPNTLRILLLGGSVLYSGLGGWFPRGSVRVPSSGTIAQHLERLLREDPAIAGLNVEVINAGIGFNRIVEISSAYLAEYIHWKPDVVLVMGSANNFYDVLPAGEVTKRTGAHYSMVGPHVWALEFDRRANRRGPVELIEAVSLTAEEYSALAGVAHQVASKLIDTSLTTSRKLGFARRQVASEVAPRSEQLEYIHEYLGYAHAIAAAARYRGQGIAFFWEYFLCHARGEKPLSAEEEVLAEHNCRDADPAHEEFSLLARDHIKQALAAEGLQLVDPLAALRRRSETVYIDYLHYTEDGNAFMAGVVYDALRDLILRHAEQARRTGPAPIAD